MMDDPELTLHLTYMEKCLLLSSLRAEHQRRKNSGTVSEWHDAAASLLAKVEIELRLRPTRRPRPVPS